MGHRLVHGAPVATCGSARQAASPGEVLQSPQSVVRLAHLSLTRPFHHS